MKCDHASLELCRPLAETDENALQPAAHIDGDKFATNQHVPVGWGGTTARSIGFDAESANLGHQLVGYLAAERDFE